MFNEQRREIARRDELLRRAYALLGKRPGADTRALREEIAQLLRLN